MQDCGDKGNDRSSQSHPAQTSAGSAVSSAIPINISCQLETTGCQFCLHFKKINPIFHQNSGSMMDVKDIKRIFCTVYWAMFTTNTAFSISDIRNFTTVTCAKRRSRNNSFKRPFSTQVRQDETQNRSGCMSYTAEVTLQEGLQLRGWDHMCWLYLCLIPLLRFNCLKNCETFRNPGSAKYKRMLVSGTVMVHLLQKPRACKGVQIHEIWVNSSPFCSSMGIEPQKCNTPP